MDKDKKQKPWARSKLRELKVGRKLVFEADPDRQNTIRKQASVVGSDENKHFRVSQQGRRYEISRVR